MERTIISGVITEISRSLTKTNEEYIMGALTWDVKDHQTGQLTPVTKYFFAFNFCKDAMVKANLEIGDVITLEGNYSIVKTSDNFGNQSISRVNFNAYKVDVILRWSRLGFYQQLKERKEQNEAAERLNQQYQEQTQTQQQTQQQEQEGTWELDL